MTARSCSDIVIVGAGLAGLNAGRALSRVGLSVVVLEARDRIGGRICTTSDRRELGCTVLSGPAPMLNRFLHQQDLGIETCRQTRGDEAALWITDGEARAFDGPDSPIALASLAKAAYPLLGSAFSNGASAGALARTPGEARILEGWYTQITGDPRTTASIAYTKEIYAYHGRDEKMLEPAMSALPEALGNGLDVRLNCPVVAVRSESQGYVQVTLARGETLEARAAIITVPPPVVAHGVLDAGPERAELARELGSANVCVATVGTSTPLPRTLFAYVADPEPTPCLVLGFAGSSHFTVTSKGPGASRLANADVALAISREVAARFPEVRVGSEPRVTVKDWGSDRYTFGGLPLASASSDACRAWLEPNGPIAWATDIEPAGTSLLERTFHASARAATYAARVCGVRLSDSAV